MNQCASRNLIQASSIATLIAGSESLTPDARREARTGPAPSCYRLWTMTGRWKSWASPSHMARQNARDSIEICPATKQRLGGDSERPWVAIDEANDFVSSGPNLPPVPGCDNSPLVHWTLPPKILAHARDRLLERIKRGGGTPWQSGERIETSEFRPRQCLLRHQPRAPSNQASDPALPEIRSTTGMKL